MHHLYYLLRYLFYKIFFKFEKLDFRVGFSSGVFIKNSRFMSIGRRVFFGSHVHLQIPDEALTGAKYIPKLSIGHNVTIGFGSVINAARSIKIGNYVLIAPLVYITDHSHAFGDSIKPIKSQGISKLKSVLIKDGAWIGTKVTILPGVTIGKNAVVGANSVVTRDVADHAVVAGNPARPLKKRSSKVRNSVIKTL